MASVHPTDGYRFDPATASTLEAALHRAATDARAAAATWAAGAADGVLGYGEENAPKYSANVLEPGNDIHATVTEGLEEFARQVQAWTTSTTSADQDAASGFGSGSGSASTQIN